MRYRQIHVSLENCSKSSFGNFSWRIRNVRISFEANTISTINIFQREEEFQPRQTFVSSTNNKYLFSFHIIISLFIPNGEFVVQFYIHDIRHILFLAPSSPLRFHLLSTNWSIEQNDSLRSVATYFDVTGTVIFTYVVEIVVETSVSRQIDNYNREFNYINHSPI